MKLEDQVISLDLAKRLKELGVKQESIFQWSTEGGLMEAMEPSTNQYVDCAAFTVAELGELLPYDTGSAKCNDSEKLMESHGLKWGCASKMTGNAIFADTEADARAKMLIYLIENGVVKL